MSSASSSPFGDKTLRSMPHIRLNSDNDNILDQPQSSRSLLRKQRRGPSITNIGLYRQQRLSTGSAERLLPLTRNGYRDEDSPPFQSPTSDRSTKSSSWSSDPVSHIPANPFSTPFDDPPEELNTQTVSEKYNIRPYDDGLLLFPEDVENDDWLHNPDPNEKDEIGCHLCSRRGLVNWAGLVLIVLGFICLLIGYPVM
jgi:hypothetical protein